MNRKITVLALGVMLFALCFPAVAQQSTKVHRIGVLSGGFPGSSPDIEAFRQGLRDLGYVEGKNLSSSTDMLKGNATIGILTFFQTSSASKLTSSSGMALGRLLLRRKQPARSPLS